MTQKRKSVSLLYFHTLEKKKKEVTFFHTEEILWGRLRNQSTYKIQIKNQKSVVFQGNAG